MKKGFTLMELLVVIMIIGILGTLGLVQYTRTIEKSHIAEVYDTVAQIRKLASSFYDQYSTFNGGAEGTLTEGVLGIGAAPTDSICSVTRDSNFFRYAFTLLDATSFRITARRNGAGGKPGNINYAGQVITDTITFPGAKEDWDFAGGRVYQ